MLNASARTHAGRVRSDNEDAALCRAEHGVFAVIDGMGGQEAGEVAAAIAAAALAEIPNQRRLASETVLAAAFREARTRILHQADADPSHRGMGAVATAIRFDDNGRHIAVAHVGDTRAWLVGARGPRQLTRDHVAPVEGAAKPAVARDLGRKEMPDDWVELARHPVARGDLLVLASDGLHDPVPESELAEELRRLHREGLDADAVSARLVALALARGGPDNVTVVAVRVGRFSRARSGRRYGLVLTLTLFAVLLGFLAVALVRPSAPAIPTLPDRISGSPALGSVVDFPVSAGKITTIAAGSHPSIQGAVVHGPEWTVEVGEGATLLLSRTVVGVDGAFTVLLAEGARFVVEDARVEAGAIRIVGPASAALVLRHATLRDDDGPSIEGPIARTEDDARLLSRIPAEPPPAPPDPPAGASP